MDVQALTELYTVFVIFFFFVTMDVVQFFVKTGNYHMQLVAPVAPHFLL
jgi:hypothetical protein